MRARFLGKNQDSNHDNGTNLIASLSPASPLGTAATAWQRAGVGMVIMARMIQPAVAGLTTRLHAARTEPRERSTSSRNCSAWRDSAPAAESTSFDMRPVSTTASFTPTMFEETWEVPTAAR
jgi:hypothetical protein